MLNMSPIKTSRATWDWQTKSLSSFDTVASGKSTLTRPFVDSQPRREGDCSLFVKYSSPTNPMVVTSTAKSHRPRSPDQGSKEVFPQFAEVSDSCVAPSLVAPRPYSREIIRSKPYGVSPQRSQMRTTPQFSNTFSRMSKNQTSKSGTLLAPGRSKFAETVWRPQTNQFEVRDKGKGWTFHQAWNGC